MHDRFYLNGDLWRVVIVPPNSPALIDRTGNRTVATTDPSTGCVYLSDQLRGEFLFKVLLHELGHCTMISFNLLDDIHKMVLPQYWIYVEEWVCNFIADYGEKIFSIAYSFVGNEAWRYVPYELERMIA